MNKHYSFSGKNTNKNFPFLLLTAQLSPSRFTRIYYSFKFDSWFTVPLIIVNVIKVILLRNNHKEIIINRKMSKLCSIQSVEILGSSLNYCFKKSLHTRKIYRLKTLSEKNIYTERD